MRWLDPDSQTLGCSAKPLTKQLKCLDRTNWTIRISYSFLSSYWIETIDNEDVTNYLDHTLSIIINTHTWRSLKGYLEAIKICIKYYRLEYEKKKKCTNIKFLIERKTTTLNNDFYYFFFLKTPNSNLIPFSI